MSPKTTQSDLDVVTRKLMAIIGHGAQGAAIARTLARKGVRTRADLKNPDVIARLPRESQANVLFNPVRNAPIATALRIVAEVKRRIVFDFTADGDPRPLRFEVLSVGSVRRQAARVKDIDFLVVVPTEHEARAEHVLAAICLRDSRTGDGVTLADTYAAGTRRRSLILRYANKHYRSDFFLATAGERPFAMLHYTGPKAYNIRIRAYAKRKGWRLNQYGLFSAATGQKVRGTSTIRTERELIHFLGVTYRPAQDRNGIS